MNANDPFGRTDKLDEAMRIDGAATVLDMGCGTGLAARAIAHRDGFSGRVTGIDLSPFLVAAAQRLAREEGIAERTEFRTGDTRSIEVADGAFDAVVAHTLLSHVEEPLSVIEEAARVLRSGGMVGVFDGDYASLTFDHADPAKGKVYDDALVNAVVTNPRVMRQMPRLLRAAGLELVASFPYVLSEIGAADFWSSAIEAYRRLIPKAGVMTEEEADAWAAALQRDSEAGVFFGSSNYYAYVATRP